MQPTPPRRLKAGDTITIDLKDVDVRLQLKRFSATPARIFSIDQTCRVQYPRFRSKMYRLMSPKDTHQVSGAGFSRR